MAAPPRKKLRAQSDADDEPRIASGLSRGLFAPFRALGFITNHVPFVLKVHSAKGASVPARMQILTCVGRSWAMWDGERITLVFVGMCGGAVMNRKANYPPAYLPRFGCPCYDTILGYTGRSCLGCFREPYHPVQQRSTGRSTWLSS